MFTQVDQLKQQVDALRPLPPAVTSELRNRYLVRYTYHSNAIEGNTLTQSETELVLNYGLTVNNKPMRDHLEAIGHKDAINFIEYLADERLASDILEFDIRQIHAMILRREQPDQAGMYRTINVQGAGSGYEYPNAGFVPSLMGDFVQQLNQQQRHPIELATWAHYKLVTIHPFVDGHGRTARLLMNLILLQSGYYIAVIQQEERLEYIAALEGVQQHNEPLDRLLQLVVRAVKRSLQEVLLTVRN